MLIVHVHIQVKPEALETFRRATLANAIASRQEPGILQFDALQQHDAPEHFLLIEIYRDDAAAAAHKQTEHYAVWRDTVADWMAQPRYSHKYIDLMGSHAV